DRDLGLAGREVIGELEPVEAVLDVGVDGRVEEIRPLEDLPNGELPIDDALILGEVIAGIVGTQVVGAGGAGERAPGDRADGDRSHDLEQPATADPRVVCVTHPRFLLLMLLPVCHRRALIHTPLYPTTVP